MEELCVLELFSGIGGMHCALERSQLNRKIKIISAIDINENANKTYSHNFPNDKCLNKNIQKLNVNEFQNVNFILMSPPCQPFTRNGLFKDTEDRRCDPFLSICEVIKSNLLPQLSYVLMENVMGFEKSQMREIFVDALRSAKLKFQEFIVSPTQIGVANTRHRYYCIARKNQNFTFENFNEILTRLPNLKSSNEPPHISSYVDNEITNITEYLLAEDVLRKRFQVLDICASDSNNSMCFTKSYSRYMEGTGSVYCNLTSDELNDKLELIDSNPEDQEMKNSLGLRFFTPKEVLRLMSFPEKFSFPSDVNEKQQYKLLGNSINVAVVSELIKLLFSE